MSTRTAFLLPLLCIAAPASAQGLPDFLGAAMCQPPYSFDGATDLYNAAQKLLPKPDTSILGAEIYRLPAPVSKDGFVTQEVVFAGSSVGVLVQGDVAAQLADRYRLTPETSHLLGASSRGFSRLLPVDQQGMKEAGLISLIAREGPALKGRTLLACEFVSHEDRKGLEELNRLTSSGKP
jgi:hypothetical protein